jgi:hypothetical protein
MPDEYTIEMVRKDYETRHELWTVYHQATGQLGAPAEPPDPDNDPQMRWGGCLQWHNDHAAYSVMTDDELAQAVVQGRLDNFFGDGLERDYAMAGGCTLGDPVDEMSRKDMIAELMGTDPGPCEHEHSHEVDHGDGQRLCSTCGQHFTCTDYGAVHLERWRMVDELSCPIADGHSAEFAQQIREMLDTRTVEQLRILTGRQTKVTINETKGDK